MRSFTKLSKVNPGFQTEDLFTFQAAPESESLRDGPSFAQFDMDFMERLRALPGVQTVGLVQNLPLDEHTNMAGFRTDEMPNDAITGVGLSFTYTGGDYFRAMGIKVIAGETFDSRALNATAGKIVISKAAAQYLWPGKNAVGHRLLHRPENAWFEVIGVVDDVLQTSLRDKPQPLVYLPLIGPKPDSWRVASPAYVLRTTRSEVIAPEVRRLVHEVAPSAPMYAVATMAALSHRATLQLSFTMLTLGIVSGLALILGAVGLYGVLSYVVAQRTREIGLRMALGAQTRQVLLMVVAQGAKVVGLGVVIGVAVALASTRVLESLLYGVEPADVATFVGMSASMIAVGLLAAYMPARRASSVDPMVSLRGE
jgi:predicted permease